MSELIKERKVKLELGFSQSDLDKYQPLLRYVYGE